VEPDLGEEEGADGGKRGGEPAGNRAPAVKPITANVATSTTPTATGHSGGPPHVARRAVST
jgi:hypothetical protein